MIVVTAIKTFADRSLDRLEEEVNNFIYKVNGGCLSYGKDAFVSDVKYQSSMQNNNAEVHNVVVTIAYESK